MKILRVLNTNAVVSTDPHGQEIIITGAGIGFKKKKGEELDKSLVEKIYCLKSREDNYRLQEVVREISEKYLEIAGKVVASAREAEAAFIAMHIISSEFETNEVSDVQKITGLMNAIIKIVKMHFKIEFNEDSVSYQRFLTHLKFFSARVMDGEVYQDSMEEIYRAMVAQNRRAYTGVEKVDQFIRKQYGYKLSIDEELYLLIHIKRILDEQQS